MIAKARNRSIDYKSGLLWILTYFLMIGQFVLPCIVLLVGYVENRISYLLFGASIGLWLVLFATNLRVGKLAKRQRAAFRAQAIQREQAAERAELERIDQTLPTSARKCKACKYFFSKKRMPDAITNVADTCELHLRATAEDDHCTDWLAAL